MPRKPIKTDDGYLIDIDTAAANAIQFCEGMSIEGFIADERTRHATIYAALIIGEATKHLTSAFREAHPQIPWKKMSGMRDRLIHGYDDVDLEALWEVVRVHLPDLRAKLAPLLPRP